MLNFLCSNWWERCYFLMKWMHLEKLLHLIAGDKVNFLFVDKWRWLLEWQWVFVSALASCLRGPGVESRRGGFWMSDVNKFLFLLKIFAFHRGKMVFIIDFFHIHRIGKIQHSLFPRLGHTNTRSHTKLACETHKTRIYHSDIHINFR